MNDACVAAGGADYALWLPLCAGIPLSSGNSFTCFAGFRGGRACSPLSA